MTTNKQYDFIISADSGCSPGKNFYPNHDSVKIVEIPTQIIDYEGNTYRDMIDILPAEVLKFEHLEKASTSSPLPQDYSEVFQQAIKESNHLFHVSLGENISSSSLNVSLSQAQLINEENPDFMRVINSNGGATAGKLIVTILEKLIAQGYSYEDIYKEVIEYYIPRIQTSFIVPDISGFIRSGRNKTPSDNLPTLKETTVNKVKQKALNIAANTSQKLPLQTQVDIKNGELHAVGCCRSGKRGDNRIALLNLLKKNLLALKKAEQEFLVYGTIASPEEDMAVVLDFINKNLDFENVIRQDISGVVAVYGDPNLGGISYVKK